MTPLLGVVIGGKFRVLAALEDTAAGLVIRLDQPDGDSLAITDPAKAEQIRDAWFRRGGSRLVNLDGSEVSP